MKTIGDRLVDLGCGLAVFAVMASVAAICAIPLLLVLAVFNIL